MVDNRNKVAQSNTKSAIDVIVPPRAKKPSVSPEQRQVTKMGAWMFWCILASISVPPMLSLWRQTAGAYSYFVALSILIVIAILSENARKLAISVAILPTAGIVALSLPKSSLFPGTVVYYVAILLLVLVYRYMFTLETPAKSVTSLRARVLLIFVMIVAGEVLGGIGFLLLGRQHLYTGIPLIALLPVATIFAFTEEMLFQGLIQELASQTVSLRLAMLLTVTAYAFSTWSGSVTDGLFVLLAGTVLAVIYTYRPNLILTTVVNALMKITYLTLVALFISR